MASLDSMPGKTLGRYHLLEQIGAGGMGVVYRARDERLERDVAFKVLPPGMLADDSARRRFRKEALALSRLNHPNIATVYDFDTQQGIDFLVTELVSGLALDEKLMAGPLPEKKAIELGLQLADGLHFAHQQGIVHRDIKPANLRLTSDGKLKILDFGLAQHLEPLNADSVTLSAVPAGPSGTLAYMAPEQLKGEEVDVRADVWAAGVVLYEMVTARRPFEGRTATAVADQILHSAASFPQTLAPDVSPRFTDVISKCLEKDPENRYQSAKELLVDLRRLAMPSSAGAQVIPRTKWRSPAGLAAFVAAGLLMVLAVLAAFNVAGWRSALFRGAGPRPVETVAVLPLENLSHDAQQDYFADGMTQALITDLAQISALKVIAHTSVVHYKGTRKTIPEIAGELNVDAVVEGSVQRAGDRVRVNVQLVSAASNTHLWADRYERDLRDVLALQDEVASGVVKQIAKRLGGPSVSAPHKAATVSPEAYELYLKGNYYFDNFELQKSIEYFNQSIKLDPNYAPTYAQMAQSYGFLAFFGSVPPNEGWGKAKQAAMVAVEKDEGLGAAHAALALAKLHYDWDFPGAEREFKRGLELNPSDADNRHEYAHYLMAMGRVEESEAESKRAVELDPTGEGLISCLCWHSFANRDYDAAIRLAEKFLRSQPDDPWERTILGWTYEQKRMPERAVPEFKKAVEVTKGDAFFLAALGHAYALAGNRGEAEKVMQTLSDRAKQSYVSPFDRALIHVALGEKDKAFALLDKAVSEHSTFLVYAKWDPRLDPLRPDSRFKRILKQIGLQES